MFTLLVVEAAVPGDHDPDYALPPQHHVPEENHAPTPTRQTLEVLTSASSFASGPIITLDEAAIRPMSGGVFDLSRSD